MFQVLFVLALMCALAHGILGISLPVAHIDDRIVGGTNTSIDAAPYMLSLEKNGSHVCGASIIAASFALTAANCVVDTNPSGLSLRAGSTIRGGGQLYAVAEIDVELKYRYFSSKNDYNIAVAKIIGSFLLGQPIGLATVAPSAGEKCIICGWGTKSYGSQDLSPQLQSAEVTIVDRTPCSIIYTFVDNITERMLCAGGIPGGKDTCQGDTGGPLVCNGVLAGVVSYSVGCARPGFPGIYANVTALLDWILSVINK